MKNCKAIGCCNSVVDKSDFCEPCLNRENAGLTPQLSLFDRYPDQYKSVGDMAEIDVYAVHHLFQIQDHSGCIHQASRMLLMSGKPSYRDIREARDLLSRWLQLNQELPEEST